VCLLLLCGGAGAADREPPLLLPLRHTALSPGAASAFRASRRLAGADASASLELYGAVAGVFTVHLGLGSPSQPFDVVADTGSTLAYVPCLDCGANCGQHEASPLAQRRRAAVAHAHGRRRTPPSTQRCLPLTAGWRARRPAAPPSAAAAS
jgi:hypothetical protein